MDKRVKKTKSSIRNAYFELLDEHKDVAKITVTDIANKADIDRKTFYLHYETKEDIMREFTDEMFNEFVTELKKTTFFDQPIHLDYVFKVLNNILERDVYIYRQLAAPGAYEEFWNRVESIVSQTIVLVYKNKVSVNETELTLYADLFTSGIITVYRKWLRGEIDMSLEQIAFSVVVLANKGIMQFFY